MRNIFLLIALIPCTCLASDEEAAIFRGINSIRSKHGLPALTSERRLDAAARSQCVWMGGVRRMDHMREPATSFQDFLKCEWHPSNRVVKAGYFSFGELFRVDETRSGATVFPLPAANEKVGEIIAKGWGGEGAYDTRRVLEGWMNSTGHREEILKEPFREMGVAFFSPLRGETYWCVVFAYR